MPRLYASEGEAAGRRGALAVGLTVTLAALLMAGLTVNAIDVRLRAVPAPSATPPASTTEEPRRTPARQPLTHELSHEEFGDRDHARVPRARKVGGWDHDTCDPVDGEGRPLAGHGCDHASESAYSARDGRLKAVQLLLAFPTQDRAEAAALSLSLRSSAALRWRRGGTHDRYAYGKVGVGAAGPYVVVTVVTATEGAAGRAPAFHGALHADALEHVAALYAS
ncbi:hypothetical protein ACQEUU_09800 [Nonomuraea sp. CA-218870]|uniref:hypothetical protein n=1 Tax=Nonomuraea sp. CA-218870 TaxID=3239998 RepID=UPI003D8FF231